MDTSSGAYELNHECKYSLCVCACACACACVCACVRACVCVLMDSIKSKRIHC